MPAVKQKRIATEDVLLPSLPPDVGTRWTVWQSKLMWCSFHKSATHSDETCRTQQQQTGDNGRVKCASQESDYHFVFAGSDPTPGSNLEGQGISFAAVEVPTRDESTKDEGFWLFGPTDEPVSSCATSGWFSGSIGVNSEVTEG